MKNSNIVIRDPYLNDFAKYIDERLSNYRIKLKSLSGNSNLFNFANGHLFFGCHKIGEQWVFREWAPNATALFLVGDHSSWQVLPQYAFQKKSNYWELRLNSDVIKHKGLYRLFVKWNGGEGERVPAWANKTFQDNDTKMFSAQIWDTPSNFSWKYPKPNKTSHPLIYEAHIGMSSEKQEVSSYIDFKNNVLPRIVASGYNTIQLMAIQEHPYYGSFGYHVSSLFAPSSRFGTPEDLKELVDEAHKYGLNVIMDLVHSHAVKNEIEGLSNYDGTDYQFFHAGNKGNHSAWDSKCFDYSKNEILHFLLSNCKYWLTEFNFDGFRFDGVTSMLYNHHGLNRNFTSYSQYFDDSVDIDACVYLMLANTLIKQVNSKAISIAEEMSGMPGIATKISDGGFGFDYRLAMGVPDFWIKIIKNSKDQEWNVNEIFYELTNHRADESTISYLESHDQAIVGDKTIIFRLIDKYMYSNMSLNSNNYIVDRGIALHKMLRLITVSTAGAGYLNFMGNEFGHPEWIDFPRQDNNWSYYYARRQWSLCDNASLRYSLLNNFDKDMISCVKKNNIFRDLFPTKIFENIKDQVIAFLRNNILFVFNFNPYYSFQSYQFSVPPGKYKIILSTDNEKYNGFNRIDEAVPHFTQFVNNQNLISLYIPSRTALVLKPNSVSSGS